MNRAWRVRLKLEYFINVVLVGIRQAESVEIVIHILNQPFIYVINFKNKHHSVSRFDYPKRFQKPRMKN